VFPLDLEGNRHVRRQRLSEPSKVLDPPPLRALASLADTVEESFLPTASEETSHDH
jgi:hypothetical protein